MPPDRETLERQLIAAALLIAAGLFVLGLLTMLDGMLAALVCWGLAGILAIAAGALYARIQFRIALTPRRRRG